MAFGLEVIWKQTEDFKRIKPPLTTLGQLFLNLKENVQFGIYFKSSTAL